VARGDGRLTNDLDPHDRGPQDACGVFGVWAPNEEVAKLAYFGIYALQHRGQESAGIAVSKGSQIMVSVDMGLVSQVFNEAALESLSGAHLAIGHCRYSTTGGSVWKNAQPTFRSTASGGLALGHNGNLTNTLELRDWLAERDDATESLIPGSLLNDATTDPLRRPRPAGDPAAGARPAGARLGGGQRDRGPGHRRGDLRPRGGAR
jgi:amidophosphoribosyltransferase